MDIFSAAIKNRIEIVKDYLEENRDIDIQDSYKQTLLHYAVRGLSFETIQFLLDNYINVNTKDIRGETALFFAVSCGSLRLIQMLIESGARINECNIGGRSVIDLAYQKGNKEIVDYLLSKGAKLTNQTAIFAVMGNNLDLLKSLVKEDERFIFSLDQRNNTLLHYAARMKNIEMIQYLSYKHVSLHQKNNDHETAMFEAIRSDHTDTIKELINLGLTLTIKNRMDETLEDTAIYSGSRNALNLLSEISEDVGFLQKQKKAHLHNLVKDELYDEIELFVQANNNYLNEDSFGKTPLDYANELKNQAIIKLLKLNL